VFLRNPHGAKSVENRTAELSKGLAKRLIKNGYLEYDRKFYSWKHHDTASASKDISSFSRSGSFARAHTVEGGRRHMMRGLLSDSQNTGLRPNQVQAIISYARLSGLLTHLNRDRPSVI
jgi:hypothetical protein